MEKQENELMEDLEEVETLEEAQEESTNKSSGTRDRKNPRKNQKRRPAPKRFEERVVAINRVAKTVKGGRKLRFSALVVVGDGKGTVGFATGKANEVPDAIRKALDKARVNLFRVAMVKGDTIPYEVEGKHGACKVFMKPAPIGTGVIAGGPVRAVLELAGIKNVYSKVYGSRTPINVVRATIDGIENINKYKKAANNRKKEVVAN